MELNDDIIVTINKSINRNEISRHDAAIIWNWAHETEIRKALLDSVSEGKLEIYGIKDGQPQFIKSNHNYTGE